MNTLCFQKGMTLIELISTMSILAIMTSIALPSFTTLVQDGRQDAKLTNFQSTLSIARSEAVKRGLPSAVCASTNGTSCDNTAAWTTGWLAFADNNANGSLDAGEEIVQVGEGLDSGFSLIGTASIANLVRYLPNGSTIATGTVTLCDPRGAGEAQAIVITASGRPKLLDTAAGGGALTCPPS